MYEEYFGLERPPFKITPDTSLFYEGGKRGDILAALVYAIHRGEGIIKVVGEVGSGKTMLCRMLQLKVPDTVEIVYIANPSVSADDILFVIAHELALKVEKGASKHEVMHMLQDYLLQRHMENRQVVLFVEEAQGMPLDTLEEIRLLSNLETDEHKLMQIILFGQPELDQNLAQQSIRQLRERITHNFELEPLTQDEIHNYLNFRMRQVGYTGPELINSTVAKKVEQHSAGLLRRINIIADKILLSAFSEGTHNLSSKHVRAAVNDSAFSQELPRKKSGMLWWLLLLAAFALAFAIYQTRAQWMAFAGVGYLADMQPAMQADSAAAQATLDNKPAEETAQPVNAVAEPVGQPVEEPVVAVESQSTVTTEQPPVEVEAAATGVVAQGQVDVPNPQQDSPAMQTEGLAQALQGAPQDEPEVVQAEVEKAQPEALTDQLESEAAQPPQASETPLQLASIIALNNAGVAASAGAPDYQQWLNEKLEHSRQWLDGAGRRKFSIQVMMRKASAARELVYYLRNEWPLDLSQTYLYEVIIEGRHIYRVFYSEYDSVNQARAQIDVLPESIKVNSPYVHSVNRMRRALL